MPSIVSSVSKDALLQCNSVLRITPSPVNAADSDITISSSDGVLFKVHKRNLAAHSEVFPEGDLATNDEVVLLTEESSTLELLFQYMYRQPQPDITELPFERLSKLAEAAEKYRVFSAMEICRVMMKCVSLRMKRESMLTSVRPPGIRASLPSHAIAVLAYGAKHGYSKVYSEAAPHTLAVDPAEAFRYLGHAWFVHWVSWILMFRTNGGHPHSKDNLGILGPVPRALSEGASVCTQAAKSRGAPLAQGRLRGM